MFDVPVREVMERHKIVCLAPTAHVAEAAKLMAKRKVGAVIIMEDAKLVGILTERDVVFRVAARQLDPSSTTVRSAMTAAPKTIGPDEPLGCALAIMHRAHFRHLPVVEGDTLLGVVSARLAMDPELEEFVSEAQRRKHFTPSPEGSRRAKL